MRSRLLAFLAVLASVAAAGGCGGGSASHAVSSTSSGVLADAPPVDLPRALGNGFRAGLARLAVMQQRGDDATDLGQPITPGLLDRVRCAPHGGTWRCDVRWQTAAGEGRLTRYDLLVQPDGCFSAGASPARPSRYDPTIRAYAEDPLNAIVSADPRCS